jgi:hypothetical protein
MTEAVDGVTLMEVSVSNNADAPLPPASVTDTAARVAALVSVWKRLSPPIVMNAQPAIRAPPYGTFVWRVTVTVFSAQGYVDA